MKSKNKYTNAVEHQQWKIIFLVLLIGSLTELFAAGTPVGTVIQSRSRAIYTSQSGAQVDTVYSTFVSITVAQKGSFNIVPPSNAVTTIKDSTVADYGVLITNSGNGNDIGKISAASSKGWNTKIYFDANGDGSLQSGEITSGVISQTSILASDAQYKVIVRVIVPRGELLNGVKDTTILVVKSNFDSTKTASGSYVTTVRTSGIDATNPGVIVSNPTPTVGENVTFTFSFTNNGSVPATGMTISDFIVPGFTFVFMTTNVGSFNNNSNPIAWNIGNVNPGSTVTIAVTVQINANVSPNTILGNQFTLNYSVNGNNYTLPSNSASVTVNGVAVYGVEVTALFNTLSKEPLDTVWYRFKIRNAGSIKDVIELSVNSTLALNWKLYKDGNNNGAWDATDPLLTNTNAKAGVDVDSVAIGDSVRVFAMAPIPRFRTDKIKDSMQVIAISSGDITKSDNKWGVTTMNVENVTIQQSIFPIGNQPAGTELTYSILYSNNGSAAVNNFSIVDTSPKETNYVINSVKVNGVSVSDNSSGVSITKDENNNTVIAVSVGTLAVNTNGSIEFKVKIK